MERSGKMMNASPMVQVVVQIFFVLFGLMTLLPLFVSTDGQADCLDCDNNG
jgi:hypothetical protein